MKIPFLKKDGAGYQLFFSKMLYSKRALNKLIEVHSEKTIQVADSGKYYRLKVSSCSEDDCLMLCESFLYFAKHAYQSE